VQSKWLFLFSIFLVKHNRKKAERPETGDKLKRQWPKDSSQHNKTDSHHFDAVMALFSAATT
jgi:hypothetical protein